MVTNKQTRKRPQMHPPGGLHYIRRVFQRDKLLSSRYFLKSDEHRALGYDELNSYINILSELVLEYGTTTPNPPVIPDDLMEMLVKLRPDDTSWLVELLRFGSDQTRDRFEITKTEYYSQSALQIVARKAGHLLTSTDLLTLLLAFKDNIQINERRGEVANEESVAHALKLAAFLEDLLDEKQAPSKNFTTSFRSVCIVGFHKSVLGIGEDARRLADVLLSIGYRVEMIDLSYESLVKSSENTIYDNFTVRRPTAPVMIFCMPLVEIARVWSHRYPGVSAGRYVIAYSPWELSELPPGADHLLNQVDEIWCSTQFQLDVYRSVTTRPVHLVPLYVAVEEPFGNEIFEDIFTGVFTFGFVFDFNSALERKNPVGLVSAFKQAFPSRQEKVQLVLKSLNASINKDAFNRLWTEIAQDDRIVILDGELTSSELAYFIAKLDGFVSLHRAEGFGRLVAEAMLLGTAVVCTAWSGTTDFATNETAIVVPYKLVPVPVGSYPNSAGVWAEPDLNEASRIMRDLYSNKFDNECRKIRAKQVVEQTYSLPAVAVPIKTRIDRLLKSAHYPT